MIGRLDRAARFAVVAHVLVAAAAVWFAIRAGDGPVLGPARTDDLPYGDLVTLDRVGALAWLAVAAAGLLGLLARYRTVLQVISGMWLLLAVVGAVGVIGDGDLFGMTRPGDVALALGLACTAVICGLGGPLDRRPGDAARPDPESG